jgi:hypothetical protein
MDEELRKSKSEEFQDPGTWGAEGQQGSGCAQTSMVYSTLGLNQSKHVTADRGRNVGVKRWREALPSI